MTINESFTHPLTEHEKTSPTSSDATTAKLRVENLNFFYGKTQALKDISLDVPANRVTAFIGPSGCGKSTLLRCFNRIHDLYAGPRSEGRIFLDGQDINARSVDANLIRARIGMVFQKPTPFPMSVFDNIAFGVKLYERLSSHAMQERVEWALRKAALWDEVKDKLKYSGQALSGGAATTALHRTHHRGQTGRHFA